MRILYLLEQILPHQSELSAQVFLICQGLANAGCEVHLAVSRGSSKHLHLCRHYLPRQQRCRPFTIHPFLSAESRLIPKKLGHWLYGLQAQHLINSLKLDWVLAAHPKALLHHLKRKRIGVRYGLEVHSLPFVADIVLDSKASSANIREMPALSNVTVPRSLRAEVFLWRAALSRADLVITPTQGLARALLSAPYTLPRPPRVISLGSALTPLEPPLGNREGKIQLLHIASATSEKEMPFLLNAMRLCSASDNLCLHIVGLSRQLEILMEEEVANRSLQNSVSLYQELSDGKLNELMVQADAFVALAASVGNASIRADFRLIDFCRLGRPIIAPDLPNICEQLPEGQARAFLFVPDNVPSLAIQLRRIADPTLRFLTTSSLHEALEVNPHRFSLEKRAYEFKTALK